MKREKTEAVSKKKIKKKKFNIKTYLRDFLLFVDKNLMKTTGILLVVALLIIAISLSFIVSSVQADECVGTCRDGIKLFSEYGSKISVLAVTAFAGIVPYMYAPIIGFVGSVVSEVTNLAYAIKGYGYLGGIAAGIIPLLLNIFVICIVTSLGIYICKSVTIGYRISSTKNMNFMNFRIRLYEALGKQDKVKELTQKRDEKIGKLESKKEKINYLQILNIAIVVCVIQLVSTLIQHIVL